MEQDEQEREEEIGGDILSMDVDLLKGSDLNIPEFTFIVLTGEKGYDTKEAIDLTGPIQIHDLEERGWIKHTVETTDGPEDDQEIKRSIIVPRTPFKELRNGTLKQRGKSQLQIQRERCFDEFFGQFPLKVPSGRRNEGHRPLRTKETGTKQYEQARDKYLRKLAKGYKHEYIMRVLKAEMKMRRDTGTFAYMHNMITWLNQEDFDVFAYLLDEYSEEEIEGDARLPRQDSNSRNDYGEKLI